MTGFGTAEGVVGAARVSVEIRSVNHRFFNPSIKLPSALARWETEVREAVRKTVNRGHVTVIARTERAQPSDNVIDDAKFSSYVERLRELKQRHGLDGPIDLATVLRLPDVISGNAPEEEGTSAQLVAIVERAAADLATSRESEGRRLASFLLDRLSLIEQAVARLAARAPERLVAHREHLKTTVAELAGGIQVDEQRLAQEIAFIAERLDVGEELDRFQSHLVAFREAIAGNGGDGVGKRLGFLLQELLREANTTGSKANDATMVQDVVVIKEELERLREQVENLE